MAAVETALPLFKYCRTAGGVVNAVGNYSAAPTVFYVQPPSNQDYVIRDIVVHYTAAVTQLVFDSYAAIVGGLTNGILCYTYDTDIIIDLLDDEPIVNNDSFVHLTESLTIQDFSGNVKSVSAHIYSFDGVSAPIILHGANSEQLRVVLNDNFTTITDHHFTVKGYISPR